MSPLSYLTLTNVQILSLHLLNGQSNVSLKICFPCSKPSWLFTVQSGLFLVMRIVELQRPKSSTFCSQQTLLLESTMNGILSLNSEVVVRDYIPRKNFTNSMLTLKTELILSFYHCPKENHCPLPTFWSSFVKGELDHCPLTVMPLSGPVL